METVPSSFPSVEAAEDWFRDRGVVITHSYKDHAGKAVFDACRVYSDGRCEYWLTSIGKTMEAREDVWEAEQPVIKPMTIVAEITEDSATFETKEELEAMNDMEVVEPKEEVINQ
jgi:hypothetical protein